MTTLTQGSARVPLDADEARRLQDAGALIIDERRRRPLYFDGRFLAARDLTRDQNYFLTRQADLGRAGGAGVVEGLLVTPDSKSATTILIGSGHGVTPSGEIVLLPENARIDLADIPEIQHLDAAFGLLRLPRDVPRNRSGLFVLGLRPVEFSANPIASYPTSINGARSVQDGDIIEAAAVTLIPYPDQGTRLEIGLRRASVAREIFVEGGAQRGLPVEVLPLAMVALETGLVRWVDPFLVRREIGGALGMLGVGTPPAVRRAHLLQYEYHLRDVLVGRDNANRGRRFAAAEHFQTLPAAGRMPAQAINPADFTQTYFPSGIETDMSFVPNDEIPALLEESFRLPPIDLTLPAEQQESTSVLILVPVARQDLQPLRNTLESIQRTLTPAAPGLVAMRKPLEALRLRLPRVTPPVAVAPGNQIDATWRQQLSAVDLLWYVRRRNLSYKAQRTGAGPAPPVTPPNS